MELEVEQGVWQRHIELKGVGRAHAVALLLGAHVRLRHLIKHDLLVHSEVVLALRPRHLPAAHTPARQARPTRTPLRAGWHCVFDTRAALRSKNGMIRGFVCKGMPE